MKNLFKAFEELPDAQGDRDIEVYSARALGSSPYRVAKDHDGFPALLVELPSKKKEGLVAVQLRHISIRHNVACRIIASRRGESRNSCTIIRCNTADRGLWEIFFRICEVVILQIGDRPRPEVLRSVLDQMAALFAALGAPGSGTIQGLWSELFLISEARDCRAVLQSWHATPGDRYDFSSGSGRLEVKSSASRLRRHHFSLEQLIPPEGSKLVVASIFAESAGGGVSVLDLIDKIKSRTNLKPDDEVRLWSLVAATLGQDWERALGATFDANLARQSLAFYHGDEVPKISDPQPHEVSSIEFISDMGGARPLRKVDLRKEGALFASLA